MKINLLMIIEEVKGSDSDSGKSDWKGPNLNYCITHSLIMIEDITIVISTEGTSDLIQEYRAGLPWWRSS